MRKSVGFMFIIIITTMLNGCILSKSPNTSSVAVTIGEQKIFTLSVFPANATYAWTLDGVPLSNTGKSYTYTAQGGGHNLEVTAKHSLGTDSFTWHITEPFAFEYRPGLPDPDGKTTMGTETMRFVSHGGKLYAAFGSWMEDYMSPSFQGPQILRKDGVANPWRVDWTFGPGFLRVESCSEVTFITDYQGLPLAAPLTVLLAGPSDINQTGTRWATIWMRDDTTGLWTASQVASEPNGAGVRSMGVHMDRVTGIQHLFVGVSRGAIYRGAYDPSAPGKLRWDAQAELQDTGRAMAFAEANGVLYAACGLEKDSQGQIQGGLFRRIDGVNPSWEMVYRWPYVETLKGDEARIMRGLTAVPDPMGREYEVLVGTRSNPGVVERIDPMDQHRVTTELDIRDYFRRQWNLVAYTGPSLCAYNRLVPAAQPDTGQPVHLLGLWVKHPKDSKAPYNGSYFLIRSLNATYTHGEIQDPLNPVPDGDRLRGCRDLETSPFPEDYGRIVYAGGYDCAGDPSHNTAWIYRGSIP